MMRIGLTYDLQTDPRDERQAEFDPPATIDALTQALEQLGHGVVPLGNAQDLLRKRREAETVDLVFNVAEGLHGRCREAWVPALLESWGVPFVGSGAVAQALSLDKHRCKQLAVASGVRTPRWLTVETIVEGVAALAYPVIIKPRYEGSGIGIDAGAVVHDPEALTARLAWAIERWQKPLLIEEFIPHGELTVCVIGNDPPKALPVIQRPIDPVSRLSCHLLKSASAAWSCPLELSEELEAKSRHIALTMFLHAGCRDLARVDLRVDEAGEPYFLELNALPSLDPEGSFGLVAQSMGRSYAQAIGDILDAALARLRGTRVTAR